MQQQISKPQEEMSVVDKAFWNSLNSTERRQLITALAEGNSNEVANFIKRNRLQRPTPLQQKVLQTFAADALVYSAFNQKAEDGFDKESFLKSMEEGNGSAMVAQIQAKDPTMSTRDAQGVVRYLTLIEFFEKLKEQKQEAWLRQFAYGEEVRFKNYVNQTVRPELTDEQIEFLMECVREGGYIPIINVQL